MNHQTCTDGVNHAARDEETVTCPWLQNLHALGHAALTDRHFKGLTRYSISQPCIDLGSRLSMNHKPHLRLGIASQLRSQMCRGMYLNRQIVTSIQDFHQQRIAPCRVPCQRLPKDRFAMLRPQFMQRHLRPIIQKTHTLLCCPVTDLPRLTKRCHWLRQFPLEQRLQAASTPDAGLIQRSKSKQRVEHVVTQRPKTPPRKTQPSPHL